jgi:hypothetical protein
MFRMYTCKEVAELTSQSFDHALSLRQKIGMYFHLSMCKLCSRHKKQMAFLNHLLDLNKKQPDAIHHSVTLSETKKEKIKKRIREQTHS